MRSYSSGEGASTCACNELSGVLEVGASSSPVSPSCEVLGESPRETRTRPAAHGDRVAPGWDWDDALWASIAPCPPASCSVYARCGQLAQLPPGSGLVRLGLDTCSLSPSLVDDAALLPSDSPPSPSSKPADGHMASFATFRSKGQISAFLNLTFIFLGVRVDCKALEIHSHNSCLSTFFFLFIKVHESLCFLNAILKDLSKGYRA